MAKIDKQPQTKQQQTFDELMSFLDLQFKSFPDHRVGNAVRYELADVLKVAFAMFSLKSPSLLDFKKQTEPEESNLRQIYRIEGAIPSDNQMRGMLDPLDPNLLRPLFRACYERLSQAGVIREYQDRRQRVIVSIDGVEHFSSTTVLSLPKTSSQLEILAVRGIISHSARSSGSSFFRWFASHLWSSSPLSFGSSGA